MLLIIFTKFHWSIQKSFWILYTATENFKTFSLITSHHVQQWWRFRSLSDFRPGDLSTMTTFTLLSPACGIVNWAKIQLFPAIIFASHLKISICQSTKWRKQVLCRFTQCALYVKSLFKCRVLGPKYVLFSLVFKWQ